MAFDYSFTADEMAIDDGLGYPKAYAKLCRDRSSGPYSHGPPFTFMPYCLQQQEVRDMIVSNFLFASLESGNRGTKLKIGL